MAKKQKKPTLGVFAEWLAEFKAPRGTFDMGVFQCGTRRCAIGWGIREGQLPGLDLDDLIAGPAFTIISRYFDIPHEDAVDMFAATDTKRECIATIRRYVREHPEAA